MGADVESWTHALAIVTPRRNRHTLPAGNRAPALLFLPPFAPAWPAIHITDIEASASTRHGARARLPSIWALGALAPRCALAEV